MVSSGMLLISPAVATALESTLITSVPSLAQFTSTAATKCVAFGLPAVATAALGARGGAVDLERVDLRLDSLEQYCVIASIILGSMIGKFLEASRLISHVGIEFLTLCPFSRYLWRHSTRAR
jgi:hypothetical protein